jgi:hypothetical protein
LKKCKHRSFSFSRSLDVEILPSFTDRPHNKRMAALVEFLLLLESFRISPILKLLLLICRMLPIFYGIAQNRLIIDTSLTAVGPRKRTQIVSLEGSMSSDNNPTKKRINDCLPRQSNINTFPSISPSSSSTGRRSLITDSFKPASFSLYEASEDNSTKRNKTYSSEDSTILGLRKYT